MSAAAGAALATPAGAGVKSEETTQFRPDDETAWGIVRAQFTLVAGATYLNNGTMGPSPAVVQEVTQARMAYTDASGDYGGAEKEEARAAAARFVHASPDEIALTHNVTEGICIVAAGLALRAGDEVIVSTHEHAGNSIPWLARRKRDGIVVRAIPGGRPQDETFELIRAAVTPRTKVIAIPHISCTIGQLFPVERIAALARERGIFFMIDGAHPVGMMPVDVRAIDCDAYATCGHKWLLGPKGTGFVYVRKERLEEIAPVWCGGESDTAWNLAEGTLSWLPTASRFDFATQNNALYLGMARAIAFQESIGVERIGERVRYLNRLLREGLEPNPKVRLLTPADSSSGLLAFIVDGVDYGTVATRLATNHHIRVRMVGEAGLNCIRISTHIYNTPEQVEELVRGVREL